MPSTVEFHGLMPRGKTGDGNHAVKDADWEERELPPGTCAEVRGDSMLTNAD